MNFTFNDDQKPIFLEYIKTLSIFIIFNRVIFAFSLLYPKSKKLYTGLNFNYVQYFFLIMLV